jgi:hypothetical protein
MLQRSILFRHLLAIGACVVAALALWTFTYVWTYMGHTASAQADQGRYMIGGVLAVVYGLVIGIGIFAPASFIGSLFSLCFTCFEFSRQRPALALLAAMPVVFGSAAFLSYQLDCFFIRAVTTSPQRSAVIVMKDFATYLSLPLFLYWWFTAYRYGDEDSVPSHKSLE